LVSFLKYFPENETLLFYDEPHRLQETAETVEAEYTESLKNRADAGMKEEGSVYFEGVQKISSVR
jgi:transcription-repair coupling factor (superfamily II helicase)